MGIGSNFLSALRHLGQSVAAKRQEQSLVVAGPDLETLDLMMPGVRDAVGEELVVLRRAKGWDEGGASHILGVPVAYLEGVEMGILGLGILGPEQSELRAWVNTYGGSGPTFTAAVNRRVLAP